MTESDNKPFESRFDFVIEKAIPDDSDTNILTISIRPDPRRYDTINEDGKIYFVDKFFRMQIGLDILVNAAKKISDLPFYYSPPIISNSQDYAKHRLDAVNQELDHGKHIPPKETPRTHFHLELGTSSTLLTFISLDICNSTGLRSENSAAFDAAFKIFIQELGTVVGQFNGIILKLTGDGFLAFVDHPSINTQCDLSIDLGLSLLTVLREAINPALKEKGLPTFNVRIGADFGEGLVRRYEVPATGYSTVDIASDALNRAVKIQETCDANQFRIGWHLYERIHVQWLQRATLVENASPDTAVRGYYATYSIQ